MIAHPMCGWLTQVSDEILWFSAIACSHYTMILYMTLGGRGGCMWRVWRWGRGGGGGGGGDIPRYIAPTVSRSIHAGIHSLYADSIRWQYTDARVHYRKSADTGAEVREISCANCVGIAHCWCAWMRQVACGCKSPARWCILYPEVDVEKFEGKKIKILVLCYWSGEMCAQSDTRVCRYGYCLKSSKKK